MTLKEFLKGIADAIRKKKNSTQPIDAMDFATEIENLTTGNDRLVSVVDRSITKIDKGDLSGVTAIGDYAFYNCTQLTSVAIPDTVTTIGVNAFYGCPIENVSMPISALDDIPVSNLKTVEITAVGELPINAFANSTSLNSIVIGDAVTTIGSSAFLNCSNLTNVVIGDGVTSIGNYSFQNCSNLTSVKMGDSIIWIGEFAFSGCDNLTSVYISDIGAWCNISFSGFYANPLRYAKQVYVNNEKLTNLVIPNTVSKIKPYAFEYCYNLREVDIGNSVTTIDSYAFYHCDTLASVEIGNSVISIGAHAFSDCSDLVDIAIPDSVTSIGSYAFYDCDSLTRVVIGNSVTTIGNMAFIGCPIEQATMPALAMSYIPKSNLQKAYITSGDAIADDVFSGYTTLEYVDLPNSVTTIGESAFEGCSSLRLLVIPDDSRIESIGERAFQDCTMFPSIQLPNSVKTIGKYAFFNCGSLTVIKYLGTTEQWGAITKGDLWDDNTGNYVVWCTDGTLTK